MLPAPGMCGPRNLNLIVSMYCIILTEHQRDHELPGWELAVLGVGVTVHCEGGAGNSEHSMVYSIHHYLAGEIARAMCKKRERNAGGGRVGYGEVWRGMARYGGVWWCRAGVVFSGVAWPGIRRGEGANEKSTAFV